MKKVLIALCAMMALLLAGGAASANAAGSDVYSVEPPTPKGYDMPYTLTVYIGNQLVVAYDGQTQEPVRYMICSTGKGNLTPRGTFTMPNTYTSGWDRWATCYVRYPTRIKGKYYFHSILYSLSDKSLNTESWRKLGTKASSGCVRMTPVDAQWINYNCKRGTRIRIVNDKAPGLSTIHDQIKRELNQKGHGAYQPTLKPTPTPPPPVIEPGSTNVARIKSLQRYLRGRGFYNGPENGKYEGATVDAWNAYQKAKGWDEDSIATTEEQTLMADDEDTVAYNVDLVKGDTGPIVYKVKERLKVLGFHSGAVNKTYDAATVTAVKKYQLAAGISPASGKLTASEQPRLFADTAPTPTPMPPLTIGNAGSRVKAIQTRLFSLGFYAGSVTGKYQAATANAVRAYQAAIGVPETGTVDNDLQAQMLVDDQHVGTQRTLKNKSKGLVVRALEEKLLAGGYFAGTPDTLYNAETVLAVKRYQQANGLTANGIASPALLKVLFEVG